MIYRKWLSVGISIAVIVCQLICPTFADDHDVDTYGETASDTIMQGLSMANEVIDVSAFGLTVAEGMQVYVDILKQHPQFFYVGREISYTYTQDGKLIEILPSYVLSGVALTQARESYIRSISNFQDAVYHVKDIWLDWEKVLFIHDYLASKYTYSPQGYEIYDAYGLFTEGHGVCQAFSLGFIALGQAWGLTVDMVTSTQMDHAWNHVLVDGSYYHVDVTRDLPNREQAIQHDRCLLSDNGIKSLGYEAYACTSVHACESARFEDDTGISVLVALVGKLYPVKDVWLGAHAELGLVSISVFDDEIKISQSIDVDFDSRENLTDLIIFRLEIDSAPIDQLDMFRHQLLSTYIKETAS